MMFAARGIAVSFSVFLIVYCVLSFAVGITWRRIALRLEKCPARRIADWLFALRMLPLVTAALVTLAFTVPSFLLLEPRAIDEPMGMIPLALGLCGAVLGIIGLTHAVWAMRQAGRAISTWTIGAQPLETPAPVPVLRISRVVPAMTATGIARPRVLLSGAAESMLTAGELRTCLNHEVAHVRRRDNLRKLLLQFVTFPGMGSLEAAWLEATEMAADEAAVSNAAEALDLAAALIKMSRLGRAEPPVDLTAALVHGSVPAVNARVERLIAWSPERHAAGRRWSPLYGLTAVLIALAAFAVTYNQMLVQVHAATEWLVR
jgi:Zn-dependent protease with chaperone function